MRWSVLRTLLPALSTLVVAIALAQPPSEGSAVAAIASAAPTASAASDPSLAEPAAAEGTEAVAPADPPPETAATTRTRPRRRTAHSDSRAARRARAAAAAATRDRTSVSVGRHNRGRLLNSAEARAEGHVRLKHADGDQHHGTDELVALLHRASDVVWERLPGSRLTVGDLSRHNGGRFRPHRSHQNGRDVDVGFYIHDMEGHDVEADRFFDFGAFGTTRHDASWHFDDERNWIFVEHLVTQTDAPVQYMFVSRELRRRLLAEGARRGADPEVLARAARVLYQPPAGGRHRDHFHIRVYCDPEDMPRCRNDGPLHPWLRGASALAEAVGRGETGLEDVLAATAFFAAPAPEPDLVGDPEPEPERAAPRRRAARRRSRARRR